MAQRTEKKRLRIPQTKEEGNKLFNSLFRRADAIAQEYVGELRQRQGTWPIIPTILPSFNEMLGDGLQPGVHYLAGAPGISKTATTLQLAKYVAMEHKIPVWFISLELEPGDLLARMVSQEMGIRWSDVRAGKFPDEAEEVFWELQNQPLYFAEDVDNLDKLLSCLYTIDKTTLVIIDYLQLGADNFYKGDPRDRVSEFCRAIAKVSKVKNLPILCISSMARNRYDNMKPTPESCLAAAKESGEVEYYATSLSVMLPQSDCDDNPKPAYWVVAKNRYGRSGKIHLMVDGARGLMEEVEPEEEIKNETVDKQILRLLLTSPDEHKAFDGKSPDWWGIGEIKTIVKKSRAYTNKKLALLRKKGYIDADTDKGHIVTKAGLKYLEEEGIVTSEEV